MLSFPDSLVCVCVCVCVFCLFTPFLSVLFVFHRNNLLLQHLINRHGFPITISSWGDCPPVRGDRLGGQKICGGGGTLAYRNQISVKSVFVCSTHTFHKNVCFTVCLNSAEFYDSAMVNVGC